MWPLPAVSVKDAFEIKAGAPGSGHAPGLIVIVDGRQCGFQRPPAGAQVDLLRLDGTKCRVTMSEVKEHGEGRSFFLSGLRKEDAPVGTIVYWQVGESAAPRQDRPTRLAER